MKQKYKKHIIDFDLRNIKVSFALNLNAGTVQNYYNYIAHYVTPEDYEAVKALGIDNPEAYDFKKILNW